MPPRPEPSWLASAVFYQIYPQSFQDSNADGIGDLRGLEARLPYLRDLGCDAVWINPCFVSPFQDAGYDVEDYRRIAPRYGTNADLRRLCSTAHNLGIRILLDLVPGHTSVRHPWFLDASQAKPGRHSDFYIWTDSPWTWSSPHVNLLSGFTDRHGAYAYNFFPFQPALNYGFAKRNAPWQQPVDAPGPRAVRKEIMDIMRFWLDRGVDGFRVDMAGSLVKNDPGQKATAAFWREVRTMLDTHYPEAVIVSEWSHPTRAVRQAGFHADFFLPFGPVRNAYTSLFRAEREGRPSFFSSEGRGSLRLFFRAFLHQLRSVRGYGHIALPTGNHDIPRIRHGRSLEELKTAFAFVLTLPAIPFIYYGDEIGMRYLDLPTKEGGYDRTGSRTPMQWDHRRNAGFSRAAPSRLYLPIDPAKDRPTVADQLGRPDSLLETVRLLIRIRKAHPSLGPAGHLIPLRTGYPAVYLRTLDKERILVCLNPSGQEHTASLPFLPKNAHPLLTSRTEYRNGRLLCGPESFGLFRI